MRLIILGPQGSGKGTQAMRIAETTGARHIATGDLVRHEIASGSPLGERIVSYNNRGELVPDKLILELVQPILHDSSSWILDGFPRDRAQAVALDEMLAEAGVALDRVIALQASDSALLKRILSRRQSVSTGKIYNLETDPPPADDPGPFVARADDIPEDIERRLAIYHQETEPLTAYYAQKGILRFVDATGSIESVATNVQHALLQATSA